MTEELKPRQKKSMVLNDFFHTMREFYTKAAREVGVVSKFIPNTILSNDIGELCLEDNVCLVHMRLTSLMRKDRNIL